MGTGDHDRVSGLHGTRLNIMKVYALQNPPQGLQTLGYLPFCRTHVLQLRLVLFLRGKF